MKTGDKRSTRSLRAIAAEALALGTLNEQRLVIPCKPSSLPFASSCFC
jgi:hypothetical protein